SGSSSSRSGSRESPWTRRSPRASRGRWGWIPWTSSSCRSRSRSASAWWSRRARTSSRTSPRWGASCASSGPPGVKRAEVRAGVVIGGIGGGMLEAEAWHWRRAREGLDDPVLRRRLRHVMPWSHADVLARRYGATGPRETVVLACSSGGAALGLAADLVLDG